MADNTTVETTNEALSPRLRKRPIRSFFNLFGGRTLRLNNNLGAMGIFFFRSFFMIFRIKAIPDIMQQVYFMGQRDWLIKLKS